MKFPKSMHADGWADHIDTTPSRKPKVSAASLHVHRPGARPLTGGARMDLDPARGASAPAHVGPQAEAVLPSSPSDQRMPWTVAAMGGAALIGGLALWAANRPQAFEASPAIVGSVEPQTQVAAAAPEPAPAVERDTPATAATAPADQAPEPARLGPPVTTVKPAVEPRPVAQASAAAPRPDLVVRANPRSTEPAPTPYLQPVAPVAPVAAAPAVEPPAVTPGTSAITLPPTAAGPVAAVPAAPEPAVPQADDSGISAKVRGALAADSTLAGVPIAVSTDHGVVKLEGQAPDAPTRERATVVASSAPGVKAVDNRLTLPPTTVSQASMSSGL